MITCRQLEALEDGGAKAPMRDFARAHVAHCRRCAGRIPLLAEECRRLAAATLPVDDVAVRKLRQRVLETLASRPISERRGVVGPLSPRLRRRAGAGLIAVAVAVAVAVMVWVHDPVDGRYAAAVWPVDAASARWSQERNGDQEVVRLDEGSFYLRVTAHSPSHRIAFLVPDGVIEDLGTVLRVTIKAGRTQFVAVESGRVVLRLLDLPSTVLTAGNSWSRTVAVAPGAGTTSLPRSVPGGSTPRGPQSSVSPVHHRLNTASSLDPEDAAYLAVLRMTSAGRLSEARAAAREYLARFPNGFRSNELRTLVREPSQGSREEEPATRMLPRRASVR